MFEKLSDRFTETVLDDEIVLMRLDNGAFFSITGTGCDIWRLIDGTRERETLVAELAEHYDADAAEIAGDVDAFVAELQHAGLLARP